jgi:hypothetical protein
MVRQAHHERHPAHLFSLAVVPIIGMIDSEQREESETLPLHGACPDEGSFVVQTFRSALGGSKGPHYIFKQPRIWTNPFSKAALY